MYLFVGVVVGGFVGEWVSVGGYVFGPGQAVYGILVLSLPHYIWFY